MLDDSKDDVTENINLIISFNEGLNMLKEEMSPLNFVASLNIDLILVTRSVLNDTNLLLNEEAL